MNFIKLRRALTANEEVYINTKNINTIESQDGCTWVHLIGGKAIGVVETPETILKTLNLIENGGLPSNAMSITKKTKDRSL